MAAKQGQCNNDRRYFLQEMKMMFYFEHNAFLYILCDAGSRSCVRGMYWEVVTVVCVMYGKECYGIMEQKSQ